MTALSYIFTCLFVVAPEAGADLSVSATADGEGADASAGGKAKRERREARVVCRAQLLAAEHHVAVLDLVGGRGVIAHRAHPAQAVGALDVDDGELQLRDRWPLLRRQQLDLDDPMRRIQLEHVVEERDEDVLVLLGAEDPLEREVGLGVRKDGTGHGLLGRG